MKRYGMLNGVRASEARKDEATAYFRKTMDQCLRDGLVALAGVVCTPEKGYIEDGGFNQFIADIKELRKLYRAALRELDQRRSFKDRAADALGIALLDWIDRGLIQTRTKVSDALESWADCRFGAVDGTGIQKLRALAAKPTSAT